MNIVIDIQGLKDKYNHFTPKEVAVISVKETYYGHWIVSPPYTYNALPPSIKRQNTWLVHNHHGLEWTEGETPLRAIEATLKKIAVQADRIFTRGSDKAAYLTQLTECFIINLEEENAEDSSFRNLPQSDTLCIYHGLLRKNRACKCALDNAIRIKTWLSHSDRFGSLWEYRTTTAWNIALLAHDEKVTSGKKSLPPL